MSSLKCLVLLCWMYVATKAVAIFNPNSFALGFPIPIRQTTCTHRQRHVQSSVNLASSSSREDDDDEEELSNVHLPRDTVTKRAAFPISRSIRNARPAHRWWSPRRFIGRKRKLLAEDELVLDYSYSYRYDELVLEPRTGNGGPTIGVVLIHPIGVGIGRWFHERLLNSLDAGSENRPGRLVVLSPDLLGSGTACDPTVVPRNATTGSRIDAKLPKHLPQLNISDWTDQLVDLMAKTEECRSDSSADDIDRWCVVANGGCSPIAIQVAQRSVEKGGSSPRPERPVTNVVVSSSPRLSFFFNGSDGVKVAKAYGRLCGVVGRVFWWYSCRKEGKFIKTFSEKNLVADAKNLGDTWQSNCYRAAIARGGKSRYSTFAFLAGTLQDGCRASLAALKDKPGVRIDVIKGRDTRRNAARSWFWQKSKRRKQTTAKDDDTVLPQKTFRDYVEENGNGGREYIIGGRISLAHEDADGYSKAIESLLL